MAPLQQHHFSLQHKDTIRNGYYCRSVEIICSLLWSIHIFANKGEKCWGSSSWKYGSVQLTVPHQFFCSSNSSLFSNAQQDPLNFTAVTSADIQEMEHVREHLHSMLKNARSFLENDDFDATQSNATGMKTGSLDPNVCSTSSPRTISCAGRIYYTVSVHAATSSQNSQFTVLFLYDLSESVRLLVIMFTTRVSHVTL